jgi:deoxycytidylate deaminase
MNDEEKGRNTHLFRHPQFLKSSNCCKDLHSTSPSRFTRTLCMSAAEEKVANEKCAACYRKVVAKGKKYCVYHSQAYDSLQKQHGAWMHAYAGISMGDYMKKLLTLNETGIWIKEVINAELKKESKKDLGS